MPLRSRENTSTFHTKRPCVLIKTLRRLRPNARTFRKERKGVFSGYKKTALQGPFELLATQFSYKFIDLKLSRIN